MNNTATPQVKKRPEEIGILPQTIMYLILFGFTILTLYPLIWMVINSFKNHSGVSHEPLELTQQMVF